jgi:hypothetical protein
MPRIESPCPCAPHSPAPYRDGHFADSGDRVNDAVDDSGFRASPAGAVKSPSQQ